MLSLDTVKKIFRAEIASPKVRAAESALVASVIAVAWTAIRAQFGL